MKHLKESIPDIESRELLVSRAIEDQGAKGCFWTLKITDKATGEILEDRSSRCLNATQAGKQLAKWVEAFEEKHNPRPSSMEYVS